MSFIKGTSYIIFITNKEKQAADLTKMWIFLRQTKNVVDKPQLLVYNLNGF